MNRIPRALFLIAALAACHHDVTDDDRRWSHLDGKQVYVVTGYSTMVHGNKDCPALAQSKGELRECRVENGRLVDSNGLFVGSPRERQPLCEQCIR
jgi:hypothetical protein